MSRILILSSIVFFCYCTEDIRISDSGYDISKEIECKKDIDCESDLICVNNKCVRFVGGDVIEIRDVLGESEGYIDIYEDTNRDVVNSFDVEEIYDGDAKYDDVGYIDIIDYRDSGQDTGNCIEFISSKNVGCHIESAFINGFGNLVYYCRNRVIYSVDRNFNPRWHIDVSNYNLEYDGYISMVSTGATLFTSDDAILLVDSDGNKVWDYTLTNKIIYSPAREILDNKILVLYYDLVDLNAYFDVLDIRGNKIYSYMISDYNTGGLVISQTDRFYTLVGGYLNGFDKNFNKMFEPIYIKEAEMSLAFAGRDYNIIVGVAQGFYFVSPQGELLWKVIREWSSSSPGSTGDDENIYFTIKYADKDESKANILAYNINNKDIGWAFREDDGVLISAPVFYKNELFLLSRKLYFLNKTNGNITCKYDYRNKLGNVKYVSDLIGINYDEFYAVINQDDEIGKFRIIR